MGPEQYEPLVERYRVPIVVTAAGNPVGQTVRSDVLEATDLNRRGSG